MLDKLFANDELKIELEKAKDQILTLQSQIYRKDLKIRTQNEELQTLCHQVLDLKEELDSKKFSQDRFGRISRATERNLNILKELQEEGLSYS